jgi:hypothetical protein
MAFFEIHPRPRRSGYSFGTHDKLLMKEQILAKKNAKTTGSRGTLANTHDLLRIGLEVAVHAAVSKGDEPGAISIDG